MAQEIKSFIGNHGVFLELTTLKFFRLESIASWGTVCLPVPEELIYLLRQ